jgi:hypothetical protein
MNVTAPISDWGDAVMLAITNALNNFLAAIPAILGALLILLIGWILSNIAATLVTRLLRGLNVDRLFATHGEGVYPAEAMRFQPSVVAGEVVRWLIRFVFVIAAANALNLPQVTLLLNQVLLWIPNLIVAIVILLIAPIVANFVRGAIEVTAGRMGFSNASLLGRIAQVAIVAFAVVLAVYQIGIATTLVNTLFVGLVAAFALAFGLAFGLGGRDVAAEITRGWYESSRTTAQRVRDRAGEMTTSAGTAATQPARREARVTSAASVRASDTRVD